MIVGDQSYAAGSSTKLLYIESFESTNPLLQITVNNKTANDPDHGSELSYILDGHVAR